MPESDRNLTLLVGLLRKLRGWKQAEMAARSGIHSVTLSLYESGTRAPNRAAIERIARAVGIPMAFVDGALLPVLALARGSFSRATAAAPTDDCVGETTEEEATTRLAVNLFLAAPARHDGAENAAPADAEAMDASDPWQLLPEWPQGLPPASLDLRESFEQLITKICAESDRAAPRDSALALALAQVAVQLANLMPAETLARYRAQAYAHAFVANALRHMQELRAADDTFKVVHNFMRLSGRPDVGTHRDAVLPEWRICDCEASLRRDQRLFPRALDLLERALSLAPEASHGRILLNRATTLEQAGDFETALATLGTALPLVDNGSEERNKVAARFNIAVNLCHLSRFLDAERLMGELRPMVVAIGNDEDLVRYRWLSSRIAAGMGRREEALTGLLEVQGELRVLSRAYDAALVGLEIAVLHLEMGQPREVVALAAEMAWIFVDKGVHREALAALRLFEKASEQEALTADLARQLRDYLQQARHSPRPFAS